MKFLQPDPLWRYGRHPCGTVILSTIDRRVAVLDERCIWHRCLVTDVGTMRAVQRAARSLRVSTRGTACGAFVRSSKNGDGRPSPSTHQPNIYDARRAKTPSDGGAGAYGGSRPTAGRSEEGERGGARPPPPGTTPVPPTHKRKKPAAARGQ